MSLVLDSDTNSVNPDFLILQKLNPNMNTDFRNIYIGLTYV
jgi:hypothetical protein